MQYRTIKKITGLLVLLLAPAICAAALIDEVFSEFERQVIERYAMEHYPEQGRDAVAQQQAKPAKHDRRKHKKHKHKKQLPPGLAKRDSLPPGLAKRQTLPPGLAARDMPRALVRQLPAPPRGTRRVLIDGRAVLIETATSKVLDIIEDVVLSN